MTEKSGHLPIDDTVGAFVPHSPPVISGATEGPLAGTTVAIKDLYDTEGAVTGGGSPDWLRTHEPAKTTAPAVQMLLDAGATVIGKTICDELFYSLQGDNFHYGTPQNINAPGRLPGGSSSGSAAATAAGLCDFALGSDTGGSVRVPASFCGLYGLRPTHGRVALGGGMAMAPSFDTAGWFADNAGLFRTVGPVLLDDTGRAAPIDRLVLAEDSFALADGPVADKFRGVLARAADVLPAQTAIDAANGQIDTWRNAFRVIQAHEVWQTYGSWVEATQPDFGPGIKDRMAMASGITPEELAEARPVHKAARNHIAALVPVGTVMCLPTAPCIAPPVALKSEELERFRARALSLTCLAGLSGLPQVSLPMIKVDGCPVGLSFIGWAGADEALLGLAEAMAPLRED